MTDWSQIVAEYGPLVWKTSRRLLSNEADAADCFQRTFIAAVEIARQQPVRHWPALLQRLATSRALEQLRVRIRERGRRSAFDTDLPDNSRGSVGVLLNRARAALKERLAAFAPHQAIKDK